MDKKDLARGMQIGHSLNQIAELPPYVDDPTVPRPLQFAAIDSTLVHMRALIDFLVRPKDPKYSDIHRTDYTSTFEVSPDVGRYLNDTWKLASQHVVHYADERVAVDPSGLIRADAAYLKERTTYVFQAMRSFVGHLRSEGSTSAKEFGDWLATAEERGAP